MADWWSYGVILYEMISGYTPFGSAAEDDTDVFRDILHTKIRSGARQNLLNLIIISLILTHLMQIPLVYPRGQQAPDLLSAAPRPS